MATAATAPGRFPVRPELDGDFALADLLPLTPPSAPSTPPITSPGLAHVALTGRLWHLPDFTDRAADQISRAAARRHPPGIPTPSSHAGKADAQLLHAVETSLVCRPPIARSTAALTPATARAFLAVAAHWTALAASWDDLRYFNAACKLLGAVWAHAANPAERTWRQPELRREIGTVARLVDDLTREVTARLARRPPTGGQPATPTAVPSVLTLTRASTPTRSILVLAGTRSGSIAPFCSAAAAASIPIAGICDYAPPESAPAGSGRSAYADAWYPPESTADTAAPPSHLAPGDPPRFSARDWEQVAATLSAHHADLVVLLGMPIVPVPILDLAGLGVINAHNGRLPDYRGMDAVGWALLNGDPITCTTHLARPAVDAGEVLAAVPVPYAPPASLRQRVKATQLRLLLQATRHVTTHGRLPEAKVQPSEHARQFYRLHPHLKRLLDASPYGTPAHGRQPTSTQKGPRQ
jgi:folate-dependent phosphoribosylglycinamide formyltransferase PurN